MCFEIHRAEGLRRRAVPNRGQRTPRFRSVSILRRWRGAVAAERWAATFARTRCFQDEQQKRMRALFTIIISLGLACVSFGGTTNDYPKESWAFRGYASPDAALESWTWAMSKGDKAAMLRSLTPEAQKQWEKLLTGKTESQLKAEGAKAPGGYTIQKREVSGDKAILHISMGNGAVMKMELRKMGNDWKVAGPKND
jgi:hypothetical protein